MNASPPTTAAVSRHASRKLCIILLFFFVLVGYTAIVRNNFMVRSFLNPTSQETPLLREEVGDTIHLPTVVVDVESRDIQESGSKQKQKEENYTIVHYHAPSRPTIKADAMGVTSISPSNMVVHYHEMWNHTTNKIHIPDEYKNPFNILVVDENGNNPQRPRTSLEILQMVLHDKKYQAEFEAVEAYMTGNGTESIPKCLAPDVQATRDLANRVVKARKERKNQNQDRKSRSRRLRNAQVWPYEKLMLTLPILNVGYPKVGSTTLQDYFTCIGLLSNHGQNGRQMIWNLSIGKNLYARSETNFQVSAHVFTQLDTNFDIGFYPQISLLDELHELNPDSTLVFNFRPMVDWIRSVANWHGMRDRFEAFQVPGFVLTTEQRQYAEYKRQYIKDGNNSKALKKMKRVSLSDVQIAKWWCGHAMHMREYVKEYPSHSLIELDLYDTNGTSGLLYDLFQVDTDAYHASLKGGQGGDGSPETRKPQCWGKSNSNPK